MVSSEKPSPFVFASSKGRDGRPFPKCWSPSLVWMWGQRGSCLLLAPWKWLQHPALPLPASRTGWPQPGGCAGPVLAPCSWGWRAWHAWSWHTWSWQGLCPARPVGSGLACGHKQPLSTSSPLPKSGGEKEALTVPQAGNSTSHREEPSPPGC